jgi:hypothetical protein
LLGANLGEVLVDLVNEAVLAAIELVGVGVGGLADLALELLPRERDDLATLGGLLLPGHLLLQPLLKAQEVDVPD